jgi:hypothetical protein
VSVDRTEPDATVEGGRRCPEEVSGVPGITHLLFLPHARSDHPTLSFLPEDRSCPSALFFWVLEVERKVVMWVEPGNGARGAALSRRWSSSKVRCCWRCRSSDRRLWGAALVEERLGAALD